MASTEDFFSTLFGAAHRLLGVEEHSPEERRRLKRTLEGVDDVSAPTLPTYTETPQEQTRLICYEGERILLPDVDQETPAEPLRGIVPYDKDFLSNKNDKASFPYCFIPTSGSKIIAEREEKLTLQNAAEQKLAAALGFLREIAPETQVMENVSFPVSHREWRFTAASAVVVNSLGMHVAISADASYDLLTDDPLHYYGSLDLLKNLYLSANGWIVLRFSERQALLHTESCVRTVAELIDNIAGTQLYAKLIEAFEPLEEEERPDLSQSVKASQDRDREKLLQAEELETERSFCKQIGMHDNLFAVPDIDILDRNDEPLKEEIRAAAMGTSPFLLCFANDQKLRINPGNVDFFVTKLWREGFPVTLTDTNEMSFIYLDEVQGVETV